MKPLKESSYSVHFNHLTVLGVWTLDSTNPIKVSLYGIYKLVLTVLEIYGLYGLVLDLHYYFGDLKKMSWNLCITTLLITVVFKSLQLFKWNRFINSLRMKLHRGAELRRTSGDVSLDQSALKELMLMRFLFYGTVVIFVPTWIVTRYFSSELPVPFRVPEHVNLSDGREFHTVFVGLTFAGVYGIVVAVELELAMFGILIQISREYRVLLEDIPKLNELFDASDFLGELKKKKKTKKGKEETRHEVNPWLRKMRIKILMKQFSQRLQELVEYTETFEFCFNTVFLEEFFGLCIVVLAISVQCTFGPVDFSGNLVYQMGYLSIVVVDMFSICLFTTRIQSQCFQVGDAAYSTLWYRMGPEIRRDISFIILRSQHPPKITSGKFMDLNLRSFMLRMGNVYSWLAMLRQIEFKISNQQS